MKLNYKCYKEVILYKKNPLTFASAHAKSSSKFSIKYQLGKISRNKPHLPGMFIYKDCPDQLHFPGESKDLLIHHLSTKEYEYATLILECQCSKLKKISAVLDLYSLYLLNSTIKNLGEVKNYINYQEQKFENEWCMMFSIYSTFLKNRIKFYHDYKDYVVEYLKPIRIVGIKKDY